MRLRGALLALLAVGCGNAAATAVVADSGAGGGMDATLVMDGGVDSALPPMDATQPPSGRGDGSVGPTDAGITDAPFDANIFANVTCATPAPEGAPHADPPAAYSGGTCPTFVAGTNTITTTSGDRTFILVLPTGFDPATEHPPIAFMWHWLGADANSFLVTADVQDAVDRYRFIAVIPDDKGDLTFKWPFLQIDPGCVSDLTCNCECRIGQELTFFDDMLSCVSQQYPSANLDCVSSIGVSAGALWTAQLAPRRSTHLSSMMVLSGGVGDGGPLGLDTNSAVPPWSPETHVMPAMVLWGGPDDFCGLLFQPLSKNLEQGLDKQGAYVEECIHNCGHSVPPFTGPPDAGDGGQFDIMWDFVTDHPYWLPAGVSPYMATGLPPGTPPWCAIGAGNAQERDGSCPGTIPILGSCF